MTDRYPTQRPEVKVPHEPPGRGEERRAMQGSNLRPLAPKVAGSPPPDEFAAALAIARAAAGVYDLPLLTTAQAIALAEEAITRAKRALRDAQAARARLERYAPLGRYDGGEEGCSQCACLGRPCARHAISTCLAHDYVGAGPCRLCRGGGR